MKFILKNGNIVNHDKKPFKSDILIENDIIKKVGRVNLSKNEVDKIIDLNGLYVFPGIIDMHSHLREPGSYVDINIKSQTKAAVKSGITTVVAMPNTSPTCDKVDIYNRIKKIIDKKASCKVIQVMAGTKDIKGEIISEFDEIKDLKAVSDDGKSIKDSRIFLKVLKKSKENGLVYLSHAEDENLRKEGVINYNIADKFDLKPIYNEVEDIITYRDLSLAAISGADIHFCHLSTGESLKLVRKFKKRGVNATCEVTPHHLFLSEEDIENNIGIYKMNPPLRRKKDKEALIEGVKNGDVDVIATDHAPHPMENKMKNFEKASFGIIGFETFIPLCIENLYHDRDVPLTGISKLLSFNPAKILNLDKKGEIIEGNLADITVVDINRSVKISKNFISSNTYNTPFLNSEYRGKPIYTIVDGNIFDIEKDCWYESK